MKNYLVFLFLFFICFCLYYNALNNEFIFDDQYVIVKNPYIRDISFLPQIFKTDIFYFQHPEDPSQGIYYRPLQALSYMFDYHFWKLNPAGYRLISIVLHSLAGFLLYLFVYRLFNDYLLALITASLFTIHPIQVSDVTFVSVRAVPMEMSFILYSLLASLNYWRTKKKINFFFALLSFIFAFLCREDALLLPLFIILTGFVWGLKKRESFLYSLPFFFIAAIYIFLRSRFIPCDKLQIAGMFSSGSIAGIWDYLRQLILPVGAQHELFHGCVICGYALSAITAAIVIFILIKWFLYREKAVLFGSIFYLIAMLPVVRLGDKIFAFGPLLCEHYAYIASAGFFLLLSGILLYFRRYSEKITLFLIALIVLFYAGLTASSNYCYKNDIVFYNWLLRLNPDQEIIRVNLGTAYLEKKDYLGAYRQAAFILSRHPAAWEAHLLMGNIYNDLAKTDKAMEEYKKTVILYPRSSEAYNNIALIYRAQGKNKEAQENFKAALQCVPESTLVLKNFAGFLVYNKMYNEAIPICEKILRLEPTDTDGYLLLGVALADSGFFQKAEKLLRAGLKLCPDSTVLIKNLAALYANAGKFEEAISLWEGLLKKHPADQEAKKNIEEAKGLMRLR